MIKSIICGFYFLLITELCVNARHFASKPNKRCMPDFAIKWTRELGTSPLAAVPLITDVDADGHLDIVAATFSGDIHVLKASDAKPLTQTKWPHKLLQSTVHASPLQYDFDGDGLLDILVFTSQGQIIVLSADGSLLTKHQLDGLYIQRDWHERVLTADEDNIHQYISDNPTTNTHYVKVDIHVLATPVLVDMDGDGRTDQLIIPATYYYDMDYYSNVELFEELQNGLTYAELENYLASSLVILNVTTMTRIRTIHMELTKTTAEYPGYQLFSPTVVDIDGSGGQMEIVCGSSAGHLHVYNLDGSPRPGFPIPTDTLHGQISVEDVTGDGRVDLITTDISSNVACYSTTGELQWEAQTSGSRPSGTRVASLSADGRLQVILTTDDGYVWVLEGTTGNVLEDWPFKIKGTLKAAPLLTRIETLRKPVIVLLDSNGYLQVLSQEKCRQAITVQETSFVSVISHDLIPSNPGLEFLIATDDGALVCVSQSNKTGMIPAPREDDDLNLHTWPGETKNMNNFMFAQYDIQVDKTYYEEKVTSPSFSLVVTVLARNKAAKSLDGYKLQVHLGSILLKSFHIEHTNKIQHLSVPSPDQPMRGHLVITCSNQHGKVAQQILPISFYQSFSSDLQWLLISPTIAMGLLLLFLYGFPSEQLLPSFRPDKGR